MLRIWASGWRRDLFFDLLPVITLTAFFNTIILFLSASHLLKAGTMTDAHSNSPIKLLWSGGWDSTFRLLTILLDERKPVQPYYFIVPHQRKSTRNEREAREKITKALLAKYPWTRDLLLPTVYVRMDQIAPDEEIKQAYKDAYESQTIGVQYEFMARYCKQNNIQGMEIGLHKVGDPNVTPRFIQFLSRVGNSHIFTYNLALKDKPEYVFLKYFSYPLMDFTKKDVQKIVQEKGWLPIMKKTWFCYTPIFGKIPCGVCQPCQQSIGDGMGWRLPIMTRYLHKVWDTALVKFTRKTWRKVLHKTKVRQHLDLLESDQ